MILIYRKIYGCQGLFFPIKIMNLWGYDTLYNKTLLFAGQANVDIDRQLSTDFLSHGMAEK